MSKARGLADLGNVYSDGALSNRNAIINGSFDVWQRGSPITNAAGGSYFSADRWKGYSGASRTFTQDTTSALSIGFKNCLKVVQGTSTSSLYHRIEDVRTYAGDTVTLSYWVKADAAHTTSFAYLKQYFGSGGSADVSVNMSTVSITTSWQKIVATVVLPSVEGKTIGASSYLEVYPFPLSASQTYYITGVQLEVGDTATPFEHRSYGQELALCQRYFQIFKEDGATTTFGATIAYNTTAAYDGPQHIFPVEMRAVPTRSESGSFAAGDGLGGSIAITSLGSNVNRWGYVLGFVVASGLTVGKLYFVRASPASGSTLKFDAEL
tara:strand:+ start:226 stop:1194 length:969 start_codon:yes stop_codon:yes gene_type:complete